MTQSKTKEFIDNRKVGKKTLKTRVHSPNHLLHNHLFVSSRACHATLNFGLFHYIAFRGNAVFRHATLRICVVVYPPAQHDYENNSASIHWPCPIKLVQSSKKVLELHLHKPIIGGCQKGGFPKEWFWRMFPGTKTGTRVHSDVPQERNRNEGRFACSPGTKNRNEGTFTKTILLRNRPFVSSRIIPIFCQKLQLHTKMSPRAEKK